MYFIEATKEGKVIKVRDSMVILAQAAQDPLITAGLSFVMAVLLGNIVLAFAGKSII